MRGERLWAEIDLEAVRHNLGLVRAAVGPRRRIMAVIKANAYGLGAGRLAPVLAEAGADAFGVATLGEAIELRAAGVRAPIQLLGTVTAPEADAVLAHDITASVHDPEGVLLLDEAARRAGRLLGVHLKVDTGLSRLGCPAHEAADMAEFVRDHPHLRLDGVFTHVPSADFDPDDTRARLRAFGRIVAAVRERGFGRLTVHACASAALFAHPEGHGSMVRPGVALWGIDPGNLAALGVALQPALALRSRVALVKHLQAGAGVGYGSTWRATRDTLVATVPIGYADGYPVALGNRAEAIVRGRRVPVVGRVSMDYLSLDVGAVGGVDTGDVVTLIGRDGGAEIRVEELAATAGTIPYELCCRLGARVRRVYRERQVVSEPSGRFRVHERTGGAAPRAAAG